LPSSQEACFPRALVWAEWPCHPLQGTLSWGREPNSGTPSGVSEPTATIPPRSFSELQRFGPHAIPTLSETVYRPAGDSSSALENDRACNVIPLTARLWKPAEEKHTSAGAHPLSPAHAGPGALTRPSQALMAARPPSSSGSCTSPSRWQGGVRVRTCVWPRPPCRRVSLTKLGASKCRLAVRLKRSSRPRYCSS
jgi:hypothetical protein